MQAELDPPVVPQHKLDQFRDVQGWLHYVLDQCMDVRGLKVKSKHKKADKQLIYNRLMDIDNQRMSQDPTSYYQQVATWLSNMIVFVLMFHEAGWKNINWSDLPKLPDDILTGLLNDKFFAGRDEDFKVLSREKKLLQELALRLS